MAVSSKSEETCQLHHQIGAPLETFWGFVDGRVRSVCRPAEEQRQLYKEHKRVHGIKFLSIVCPNGVITNLYGPTEGSRHDKFMLATSRILGQLVHFSFGQHREILCIYGDAAHPLRGHLQTPSRGANLVALQISWNKEMSSVHVSVKWVFGDIINYFKFLDL